MREILYGLAHILRLKYLNHFLLPIKTWKDKDTVRDYQDFFNLRFPILLAAARRILNQRIKEKVCTTYPRPEFIEGFTGKDDVDYDADYAIKVKNGAKDDDGRYGDELQTYYQKEFELGSFDIRTDNVWLNWGDRNASYCSICFSNTTSMYVSENAGDNKRGAFQAVERRMVYARWQLTGAHCCGR